MPRILRFMALLACLLTGMVNLAHAASPAPGGSCTNSGDLSVNPNGDGTLYTLKCDGANWQSTSVVVGDSGVTCSSTTEGTLSYDRTYNTWLFCNGTSFIPF